jgi:hypothetical protein
MTARPGRPTVFVAAVLGLYLALFLSLLPWLHTCRTPCRECESHEADDHALREVERSTALAPDPPLCPACLFLAQAHWGPVAAPAALPAPRLVPRLPALRPSAPPASRILGPGFPRGPPAV